MKDLTARTIGGVVAGLLFIFVSLTPTIALARPVVFVQPNPPKEGETLENFKKVLNELRILIVKAEQLGVIVPISTLAMVGQDTERSTSFTLDLTVGSEGLEVVALQNFLVGQGFNSSATTTGRFDEETRKALAAYQAKEGITPASGFFGPKTRTHIREHTR